MNYCERKCVCCGDTFVVNSANHVRCHRCKRKGEKVPTHQELAYVRLDTFHEKLKSIKGSRRGQGGYKIPELQKIIETIMWGTEE